MDPISATGLALGIASLGLQVYTGCIQGVQMLITAANFPEDCKFLNLRLRMEQQRLFAWSETCGLLDLDVKKSQKVLESNTFVVHRTTVLDLLVQVQCLFKEFQEHQQRNRNLQTTTEQNDVLEKPEADAAAANFPLPERRRNFIKKAMTSLKAGSKDAVLRLRWVSFDKGDFEQLLAKFSMLNDSMTDILDARMQVEIHHTVQDTNRGVLQLHHRIADLSRLVMALNVKLEGSPGSAPATATPLSAVQKEANKAGLQTLSQLAKFKAFNESIESDRKTPWDEATAMLLGLGRPNESRDLMLDRDRIRLDPTDEESDAPRCEAALVLPGGVRKKVWVEWKEYDRQRPGDPSPPKAVIIERVRKLAALLNHMPKPDAFRTPHCLGFFDKAAKGSGQRRKREEDDDDEEDEEEDILNLRLGLVFERPQDDDLHNSLPPVSLRELLDQAGPGIRKPRVTDRIKLAHAISNCLLYLHAVNWLHKGLRSHNILFFRTRDGRDVDYGRPYLSGFDFSRPARPEEMTDIPVYDAEENLYRHPYAQAAPVDEQPRAGGGRGDGKKKRERFRKTFDIYSLGVLFVEIAHWRPVEDVLGIDLARGRASTTLRVRESLLAEAQIAELGFAMGAIYEEAARKCIAGGRELGVREDEAEDEADDRVAARLSMAFYEEVVKKLGDVRV